MQQHEQRFVSKSFFIFSVDNPIRRVCIWLITQIWFDWLMTLLVVYSIVIIALDNPLQDNPVIDELSSVSDIVVVILFLLEMTIKWIAMGLVLHKHSYLRDGFNVLDLIVNILSVIGLLPGIAKLNEVRAIRVLRALRSLNRLTGLRLIIDSLLASLPNIASVALLLIFLMSLFAVMALQLFSGIYHQYCYLLPEINGTYPNSTANINTTGLIQDPTDGRGCSLDPTAYDVHNCRNVSGCFDIGSDPYYGWAGFDNFGLALLTMFVVLTNENWSINVYQSQDAYDGLAWLVWVSFNLICTIFTVGLFLAVIAVKVAEKATEEVERQHAEHRRRRLERRARKAAALAARAQTEIVTNVPPTTPTSMPARSFAEMEADRQKGRNEQTEDNRLFKRRLRSTLSHPRYDTIMVVIALINVVVVATYHWPIEEQWSLAIDYSNIAFSAIFLLEMLVKMFAFGMRGYFSDHFNKFDFILVVASILDFVLYLLNITTGLTAFRSFRTLRAGKVVRQWKGLHRVIITVIRSLPSIAYITLLLIIFVVMYAVAGVELFAGTFPSTARPNFDSFWWACLTTFQVLTGCDWSGPLYDSMHNSGWNAIYFISLFVIGSYVLVSLFIGVLLSKFAITPPSVALDPRGRVILLPKSMKKKLVVNEPGAEGTGGSGRISSANLRQKARATTSISSRTTRSTTSSTSRSGASDNTTNPTTESNENSHGQFSASESSDEILLEDPIDHQLHVDVLDDRERVVIDGSNVKIRRVDDHDNPRHYVRDRSLFLFGPNNRMRLFLDRVLRSLAFEITIGIVITLNAISLALESPSNSPEMDTILRDLDYAFTAIYILEMLMKIFAWGFVMHRKAYLRSGWNVLDFIVVLISIFGVIFPQFSVLQGLRAIRVLRIMSRFAATRMVVRTLISTLPSVVHVLAVVFIIWATFATVGVYFFGGQFFMCNDGTVQNKTECVGNFTDPTTNLTLSRTWENPPYNFDNIGNAYLTLFVVAAKEEWNIVMYSAVDIAGYDLQPIQGNHPENAIFFLVFIIIGSFFSLNLFTGAIVDHFLSARSRVLGLAFLTKKQQKWLLAQQILEKASPSVRQKPAHNPVSRLFYKVVEHTAFELSVMFVILFNGVTLAVAFYKMPDSYGDTLETINEVCLGLFILEAVMKIIAYGPLGYLGPAGYYFRFTWNKFDAALIIGSTIGLAFQTGNGVNVARIFRFARLLRLVKRFKPLRIVFKTFVRSLPSLLNIAAFIFVVYYIYAILGVALLGDITPQSNEGIGDHAGFENFPTALLTLYRVSLVDDWPPVMWTATNTAVYCTDPSWNCGQDWYWVYFHTFIFIQTYLNFNLFLAVLMQNFTHYHQVEGQAQKVKEFRAFASLWKKYDAAETGMLHVTKLLDFLLDLGPPLGVARERTDAEGNVIPLTRTEVIQVLKSMELDITEEDLVTFGVIVRGVTIKSLHVRLNRNHLEVRKKDTSPRTAGTYFEQLLQEHQRRQKESKGKKPDELAEFEKQQPSFFALPYEFVSSTSEATSTNSNSATTKTKPHKQAIKTTDYDPARAENAHVVVNIGEAAAGIGSTSTYTPTTTTTKTKSTDKKDTDKKGGKSTHTTTKDNAHKHNQTNTKRTTTEDAATKQVKPDTSKSKDPSTKTNNKTKTTTAGDNQVDDTAKSKLPPTEPKQKYNNTSTKEVRPTDEHVHSSSSASGPRRQTDLDSDDDAQAASSADEAAEDLESDKEVGSADDADRHESHDDDSSSSVASDES